MYVLVLACVKVNYTWPCMWDGGPYMDVHVWVWFMHGVHMWVCSMHGRPCVLCAMHGACMCVEVQAWACMYGEVPYMGVHVGMEDHACVCLFDGRVPRYQALGVILIVLN